jgi:16S rRNA (uracil1498-N3)-methyltransferase
MNLFYQPNLPEATYLDTEESKHCVKVLRMQAGDSIEVIDGKGSLFKADIIEANHKKCSFSILEKITTEQSSFRKHIAIAPTKNIDRIEWFVEKAVEIGIDEISFILCDHSERKVLKPERLEKKALSAMKQSYKFWMPKINELKPYNDFLQLKHKGMKSIAFVDFENPVQLKDLLDSKQDSLVLIGPEGDFSEQEVKLAEEAGFKKVGLGNSRLRTETAGIVACHLMNLA